MLFDNHSTQTAQASLDALWLKTQVISNNMANVDTPGFKASTVSFEEVLSQAAEKRGGKENGGDGGDSARGASFEGTGFRTTVATHVDSSVRVDENNVVLEEQQSELWKTYAQYSYLLDRLGGHYNNINSAISTMRG